MKFLLPLMYVTILMMALTSCVNEKDIARIRQKAAQQATTYNLIDTDRVVDAYFKKFRINAPKGTALELDESKDICYRAVSGDGKSSIYVISLNANDDSDNKKERDQDYVWKKKYILGLDTTIFNLGQLSDKYKKNRAVIRVYNVDEDTEAITKTYYSNDYAYLLCAYYPKEDPSYAHEVIDSFSPTRVLPPIWLTLLLVALMIFFLFIVDNKIGTFLGILCILILVAILLAPSITEYIRGYIPFKSILTTFLSMLG